MKYLNCYAFPTYLNAFDGKCKRFGTCMFFCPYVMSRLRFFSPDINNFDPSLRTIYADLLFDS